ncbi:phosphoserine phosphatase SerB [Candidatus Liberibacter sp.]|uniref:phosphoserine phosphatase SerB n=1 Tax=Candidatus Liberibacter sp. TaxID=34022 RepID=UPI0015F67AC3|nr:phosphoserine phosphatase SerB [Candidatus Liberibacter sp.]MBA5724028.1 phosphoserine phosphatase SerB [Candidatus Liberibacter sp.]
MALVVTLITHQSNPILNKSLVEQIMTTVNASSICWLADSIACDIILPPNTIADSYRKILHSIIAGRPIDIVIHKTENRRKSLLVADMDSTMIKQECIDELADTIGIKDKVSHLTSLAMNGKMPFQDSLRERVSLLKGIPTKIVNSIMSERITYTPGGYELIHTMKKNGAFTILVSGGFTVFASIVAHDIGFDKYYANHLMEENGKFTGKVLEPILDHTTKSNILRETSDMLNICPEDALAVGDGKNDLEMIQLAGSGVALHAKPILAEQAKIRIDHGDLKSLLYIQGYKEKEIVVPQ